MHHGASPKASRTWQGSWRFLSYFRGRRHWQPLDLSAAATLAAAMVPRMRRFRSAVKSFSMIVENYYQNHIHFRVWNYSQVNEVASAPGCKTTLNARSFCGFVCWEQ